MDTSTKFAVVLRPYNKPTIGYSIDSTEVNSLTLDETCRLNFDLYLSPGTHKFVLDFNSKTNATPDMAVEIVDVIIEDICVDRFKWAGIYRPRYPEPWASEQKRPLDPVLYNTTYLGWNGTWELEFTVPIFAWIHQVEHLGWIYSIDPTTGQLHRSK